MWRGGWWRGWGRGRLRRSESVVDANVSFRRAQVSYRCRRSWFSRQALVRLELSHICRLHGMSQLKVKRIKVVSFSHRRVSLLVSNDQIFRI